MCLSLVAHRELGYFVDLSKNLSNIHIRLYGLPIT